MRAWLVAARTAFSPGSDDSFSRNSAALSARKLARHARPDREAARVWAMLARYSGVDAAGPRLSRCSASALPIRLKPA